MRHNTYKSILAASALMLCMPVFSQTSSSAYFLEGSFTRQMLNPAFQPERSYLIVPALSNLNITSDLNAGLSNFIYDSKSRPGELTTFMSKDVDKDLFLSKLPEQMALNASVDMTLLSIGIGGADNFFGVSLNLRDRQNVTIPKSMFAFMKAGLSNGEYTIENMCMESMTYAEIAMNYSQKVVDNLSIGATFKVLVGGAYASAGIDRIDANLSNDSWKVKTDAKAMIAIPGGRLSLDNENSIDGFDYSFETPGSYGWGLDLGAAYDFKGILEGLTLSASITDLGAIKWMDVQTLKTDNLEFVEFDGFDGLDVDAVDDDPTLDNLKDDFKDMFKLYEQTPESLNRKIGATMRFGVEYHLPWVKCLSIGELITKRSSADDYFEARTSLMFTPCDWFELSGNVASTTLGTSFGGIMNLHMAGLNFFVAADALKMEVNPQMIPMEKFYANLNVGLNIPIGKRRF